MSALTRDLEDIEMCAGRWILRRDRGELTPAERSELETWLSSDSRHREAYLQLDEAWRASAALKAWRPADGRISNDMLGSAHVPQHKSTRLAIAASVLALVAASLFVWRTYFATSLYTTEVGGYERVLLEDGSVLQLNTDTRVQVRLTEARREVQLLRGEAYFVIARDPQRPFDVVSGDVVVRALGTEFSVHRKGGATVVAVTEGKVALARPAEPRDVTLEAGELAEAAATRVRVEQVAQTELTRRLAWQTGELHFKNESLAEVVAEFNRYNRRRIEIVDAELARAEVGGNFKANDLTSFVEAMRRALAIRIEETPEVIRIHAGP
jgi:transmembrane sensor